MGAGRRDRTVLHHLHLVAFLLMSRPGLRHSMRSYSGWVHGSRAADKRYCLRIGRVVDSPGFYVCMHKRASLQWVRDNLVTGMKDVIEQRVKRTVHPDEALGSPVGDDARAFSTRYPWPKQSCLTSLHGYTLMSLRPARTMGFIELHPRSAPALMLLSLCKVTGMRHREVQ